MPPSYIRKDGLEIAEKEEAFHRFFDGFEGILHQHVTVYKKKGPVRQWRKIYGILDNSIHSLRLFAASNIGEPTNFDSRSLDDSTVSVSLNNSLDSTETKTIESDLLKLRSKYCFCVGEFIMDEETLIYDTTGNIDGRTNLFYFSQPHIMALGKVEPADSLPALLRKVGDIVVDEDFFYLSSSSTENKAAWLEALIDSCHNGLKIIHQPEISISALKENENHSLFYPMVDLRIYYGDICIENGNVLKPSAAEVAPMISYRAHSLNDKEKYSLLMLDIDPAQHLSKGSGSSSHDSHSGGSKKAYLHWCIASISGSDIASGKLIVPYEPPAPAMQSGLHRYFFLLFKHPKKVITTHKLLSTMHLCSRRENFPYEEWAHSMGFGNPVGVNGFYSGWEEGYCDRIHDSLGYIPPDDYRSAKQKAEIISSDHQLEIEYAKAELYKNLNLGDILPSISNMNNRNSSDLFPSIALSIRYAPTADNQDCIDFDVNGGNILTATTALHAPVVTYNCRKNGLAPYFTLVLTDPDVPSRVKPSMRESIHWVVMNIPCNRIEEGVEVLPYVGAAAPYGSGLHRYVYLLYQQTAVLSAEHLAMSNDHFKSRRGLHTHSFLTTLRDTMGNSLLMVIPVGLDAFLSEWEPLVDEIHRSMDWLPPMAFLSPGQTLLAVNKHIESEENNNKVSLLTSTSDGSNLVAIGAADRNRNHRPYKRVQLSTSMDSAVSATLSIKSEVEESAIPKEVSPSEDSAESRLAAFYKSGLTNSSESCDSELQNPSLIAKCSASATAPVYDGTEPSSSIEDEHYLHPQHQQQQQQRSPSRLYSVKSEDIAAAANSAEDLCQIFGITSSTIFSGDRVRKKFSTDYLFKESFIWVDPVRKSLHWSKIGCGRSKPEQSKYLSFARRGISAKMSGKDGSGSKQQSPKAKASEVGAPNSVVPMGEAKGVVSSVDPISGGVLITTEAGEHLDIKISQPVILVDMIKVLKELNASMRYSHSSGSESALLKESSKAIY